VDESFLKGSPIVNKPILESSNGQESINKIENKGNQVIDFLKKRFNGILEKINNIPEGLRKAGLVTVMFSMGVLTVEAQEGGVFEFYEGY